MKRYEWGEDPEMSGPRNYFRETLMVNAVLKYKKKGDLLDAGCGSGNLSFRFTKKRFQIHAVDIAEKSLKYVRSKVKKNKLEKKIFVKKVSLLKTKFKKNTFDAIVCGEVLEHIIQDTKVISEFYRVLKNKGVCVVTVPGHPELWDISDDISAHVRRYTVQDLKRKFEKAGFQVIYCRYWGYPLNNLWHRKVFLPFLENKMKYKENITTQNSIKARLIKSVMLQKAVSKIFYIDFLFNFSRKGNAILLIAKKK